MIRGMKVSLSIVLVFLLSVLTAFANPEITSITGSTTVVEGTQVVLSIIATAADNGSTHFTTDATQGTLTQLSSTSAEYVLDTAIGDAGSRTITFSVADDNSTDSQPVTLTIQAAPDGINIVQSTVALGGASTRRSNLDEDFVVHVTQTFTVQNTGSSTLSGIALTSTAASDYNISFENVPVSLAGGETATVTVRGTVPIDLDAVDEDGEKIAVSIGNIVVSANSGALTDSAALTMEAENQLRIEDARLYFDGDQERLDDGDTVKDLKPGMDLSLELELENRFSDADEEDFEIQDIEIVLELDEDGWEVDEDADINGIDAEDTEIITIDFEVDRDADDRTFTLYVRVVGEDENGALHGEVWEIDLQVDRETHEILFSEFEFSTPSVCPGDYAEANVEIENTGKRDEEDVRITLENRQLGLSKSYDFPDLDEGDDYRKTISFLVDEDTAPGSYLVTAIVNINFDDGTDILQMNVDVKDCSRATVPPTTGTTNGQTPTTSTPGDSDAVEVITVGPSQTGGYVPAVTISESAEKSSGWLLPLMIVAIILLVILVIVMIAVLVRDR